MNKSPRILAAHQPDYLPSIPVFKKLVRSDHFVLADKLQFSTNSTTNKGKILTVNGPKWLTVPVLTKGKGVQSINKVVIDNSQNWSQKHYKSLTVNYRFSPYFEYFIDFFERLFRIKHEFLTDLNVEIFEFLIKVLRLDTRLTLLSEIILLDENELIAELMHATGSDQYCIFSDENRKYINSVLKKDLIILDRQINKYPQQFAGWYPALSIIDLLFNRGPEALLYLME